jgi:gluconokinase
MTMRRPSSVVVVMGVSGSGKTTIGTLLAGTLGWDFVDGDDLHPPANVAKMRSGTPLTDDDRWPWLEVIATWIDAHLASGQHGVVTCSALKRAYRDRLLAGREGVRLVYLCGSYDVVAGRQAARQGHFMPAALIRSQFETLEPPGEDEHPITARVDLPPVQIVADLVRHLNERAA